MRPSHSHPLSPIPKEFGQAFFLKGMPIMMNFKSKEFHFKFKDKMGSYLSYLEEFQIQERSRFIQEFKLKEGYYKKDSKKNWHPISSIVTNSKCIVSPLLR